MARLLSALALVTAAALGTASAQSAKPASRAVATFAGGCFWCVEADFDKVPGVISTTSGYTGGKVPNPTYRQVSSGSTGHTEAVEIVFDPAQVSYQKLLDVFWRNHDPFAKDRQFCDQGDMYRAAIFFHDDGQRVMAQTSKYKVQVLFMPRVVVTEIAPAGPFYKAEQEHQDYYKKNALKYRLYRFNCGRDKRLEELWPKGRLY